MQNHNMVNNLNSKGQLKESQVSNYINMNEVEPKNRTGTKEATDAIHDVFMVGEYNQRQEKKLIKERLNMKREHSN